MTAPASQEPGAQRDPACPLCRGSATWSLTPTGGRLLVLGIVLGFLATLVGSRELLVAGAFAAVLPLVTALFIRSRPVDVGAEDLARGRVGLPLTTRVRLANRGAAATSPATLRLARLPLPLAVGAVPGLAPGGALTWEVPQVPTVRGISSHLHLELTVTDALGLALRRRHVLGRAPVRIGPAVVDAPPLPAVAPAGAGEPGELRPWRAADGAAAVAWRASSRRPPGPVPTLLTRARMPEEPGVLRVALTGGIPGTEERAVEVLAALGTAVLSSGRDLALALGTTTLRPDSVDELSDALAGLVTLPNALPTGAAADVVVCCAGQVPATALPPASTLVVDATGRVHQR